MSAIYRKTIKGLAELEDRTHGLTPRMRALLILVDGQRDAKALRMLWSQEVQPALADLQRDGYIELVSSRRSKPPATFREPVTVMLPPAPMADVEIEELPGFTPLPPPDPGRLDGAGGDGVDLLLDELAEPLDAAVAAPPRLPVEAAPAALAPSSVPVQPAPPAHAPAAHAPPPITEVPLPTALPQVPPAPVPVAKAIAAPAAPPTAVAPRNPVFEARRRAAVRALNEEVGDDPDPQVHTLAVRMVRAQTPEALHPLLVEGTQLIARLRDRASAEVYAMRFLA